MSKNTKEPLLTENENRYVMFPIVDHDIWKMYKKQDSLMSGAPIDRISKELCFEKLNDASLITIKF